MITNSFDVDTVHTVRTIAPAPQEKKAVPVKKVKAQKKAAEPKPVFVHEHLQNLGLIQ